MDTARFDQKVQDSAQATGRRDAMRSLGASGLALLTALGLADASAKGPGKGDQARVRANAKGKKRKTKRGPAGPAGLVEFKTRVEVSEESPPLSTTAGDTTLAFVDCGGAGKVVSCGYRMGGPTAEWATVFIESVGPDLGGSECDALISRTTDVGATGGVTIRAIAICLE